MSPYSVHQVQITQPSCTPLTVNNGPPERSRTRSPLWSKGAERLCVVVVDCAGAARAGTAHEALTATPSIAAIAGRVCFDSMVKPNVLAFEIDVGGPPRSDFL